MSNAEENDIDECIPLIEKTVKIYDENISTVLIASKVFAKELDIERSMVSMLLLDDCDGNKHLIISKYFKEIVID